ncbi:MAG: alkaline phosphatase family protein [Pseudonocardiaceae bacterium]
MPWFNAGAVDKFVSTVGTGSGTSPSGSPCVAGDVMNYYDGNTVTGLWNYAQHFAMSDNSFGTTFGPSSPGAINLVSGNTGGVGMTHTVNNPSIANAAKPNADLTPDGQGGYSLTSDAQPFWDDCSMTPGSGQYGYKDDYIPHHQPFNYYASTANPHHLTLPTDTNATSPLQHSRPSAQTPSTTSTVLRVADALTGPGQCGTATPLDKLDKQQGRCGYGPRMPLLVISPWAKANNVDHTLTDQSSITRFVEDNWSLGRITGSFDNVAGSLNGLTNPHGQPPNGRPLLLDPTTGQVQATPTWRVAC